MLNREAFIKFARSVDAFEIGIPVSNLVRRFGIVPDKNTNREASKILLELGWKKGDKRLRDGEDRYYLWFSPAVQEEPVKAIPESEQIFHLQNEVSSLKAENKKLQQQVSSLRTELDSRITADIDAIRSQADSESYDRQTSLKPILHREPDPLFTDDGIDLNELRRLLKEDQQ